MKNRLVINFRRFFRNFRLFATSSPSDKPGFLPIESVEKLMAEARSPQTPNSPALPESISSFYSRRNESSLNQFSFKKPSLSGPLDPRLINRIVSCYPNQNRPNVLDILKIQPIVPLSFSLTSPSTAEILLDDVVEEEVEAEEGEIQGLPSNVNEKMDCANVLKKRRRKMRGHKHKKRLKERRHKSDK